MYKKNSVRKRKINYLPYCLLIPSMTIFAVFVFFPFIKTIIYSFSLTNFRGGAVKFVGLQNYIKIFTAGFEAGTFLHSMLVSLKFAIIIAVPSICLGFLLALFASFEIRGNRLFQVLFSLPMAAASAPVASIFMLLFAQTGLINYLLKTNIRWINDPKTALCAVAFVTVWMNTGVNFIFSLAGVKNVPEELLESADLEGVHFFQKVIHVIIPLASPQLFFVIFFNIVTSFQAFAQIRLLTEGGPSYTTNVMVYSIYRTALLDNRYETAFAQSIILFVIILGFTQLQFLFEKKAVHYQ